MDNYEIFISYRREGGKDYARYLELELEKRGYKVFLDYDALTDGKFDKHIKEAIDAASVFIYILSPNCFDRCVNANDWVRQEIEYAFEREKHIVPVNPDNKFNGFAANTPKKLRKAIGQHQFSEISTGTLFKVSMDKMVAERIEPILRQRKEQSNRPNFASDTTGQGPFTSVLKVETDLDCQIFVDGEDRGFAVTGNVTRVPLRGGSYHLRFVAKDDPDVFSEEKRFRIDRDTEEWYSVELMPQKKAAEERKREEERKKQAEEDWKTGKKYYDQKNYTEAFSWYKKAAEQGNAIAQNWLGWCYQYGRGTAIDKAQAFSWYKKAAEQGNASAQNNLGWCYQYGIGTTIDKAQTFSWYKKAAEQGYAAAQSNLGWCYQNGIGTIIDKAQAFSLYKKAAEQGNAIAQFNLGLCYEDGTGTAKYKEKAVQWYRKAAEQGQEDAQKKLINLAYDGVGTFYDGLAAAIKDGKWGYIDKTGKEVIPFVYDDAWRRFIKGFAGVMKNKKWGYIDKMGKEITPFVYDCAEKFSEGLARVWKNGKWGYIDETGREVIPFVYHLADDFCEGLAKVMKNKWGYVDKTGREVTPFCYDDAWDFSDGLARVKKNGYYGYIDKTGREIIPFVYEDAHIFRNGRARVTKNGKDIFIDKTGKWFGDVEEWYHGT